MQATEAKISLIRAFIFGLQENILDTVEYTDLQRRLCSDCAVYLGFNSWHKWQQTFFILTLKVLITTTADKTLKYFFFYFFFFFREIKTWYFMWRQMI